MSYIVSIIEPNPGQVTPDGNGHIQVKVLATGETSIDDANLTSYVPVQNGASSQGTALSSSPNLLVFTVAAQEMSFRLKADVNFKSRGNNLIGVTCDQGPYVKSR